MKNLSVLLIFVSSFFMAQSSQAVQDLRKIPLKYSKILNQLVENNKKNLKEESFLKEVDSLNIAYESDLNLQLQKIKEYEDTAFVIPVSKDNSCSNASKSEDIKTPDFEKYLKKYKKRHMKPILNEVTLTTIVTFSVEATGDVSFVRAEGSNSDFNRRQKG